MPITPFGWHNQSTPAITASNLEAMHAAAGAYADSVVHSQGPSGPVGPAGPAGPQGVWRGLWSSGTTYAIGDGVTGSNGHNYISLAAGNVANNPVGDLGVHWSDLLPSSVPMLSSFAAGQTVNTGAYLASVVTNDLTSITIPNQGTPTSSAMAIQNTYADSGAGNLFQFASDVTNPGSRNTVAVFGSGRGNSVWGGNYVGYTLSTGDTAIGVEVDVGNIGGAGQASGASTGIVIVEESGNIAGSPTNTAAGLQIQGHNSSSGFASALRIQANATTAGGVGVQLIGLTAAVGLYLNTCTITDGISITNGTYTNCIRLNGATATVGLLMGATLTRGIDFATGTFSSAQIRWSTGSTGAASALLGANSPATVPAAPYTWLKFAAADNTVVYVPAWK